MSTLDYVNYVDYLNQAVAAELKAAYVAERLNQTRLSEITGISMVTLQRVLAGTRDVTVANLGKISAASKVDPETIMERAIARAQRLAAEAASEAASNVKDFPALDLDDTGAIDAYQGDKAAYRDPEADTDEH